MSTYYLVRHGMRVSRMEDTVLTDIGIKQAELTAKHLKDKNIQEIYASPLKRTQQTASIINAQLNLQIKTDDRLVERLLFKDFPHLSFDDFIKEWDKTTLDRNYSPNGRDSSISSGRRLESLIEDVDSPDKIVLIVAHGGVISDFLRNHFPDDLLPFQTDTKTGIKYQEILECSISIVEKKAGKYILKEVNNTAHIPLPLI